MSIRIFKYFIYIFCSRYVFSYRDYILENRLRYLIGENFRNLQNLPDQNTLPLDDNEKYSIERFLKSFLRKINFRESMPNETYNEEIVTDLKNILANLKKEQVEKFLNMSRIHMAEQRERDSENKGNMTVQNTTQHTEESISVVKGIEPIRNETVLAPERIDIANNFNITKSNTIDSPIKKSEILNSEMNGYGKDIFENFVDEMVSSLKNDGDISKRKEIGELDQSELNKEDVEKMYEKLKAESGFEANKQLSLSSKPISDELFSILSKEGWKEYQKLTSSKEESAKDVKINEDQKFNYVHWNFEKFDGRKVTGSPGNPLKANGNILFNEGSVTFLENNDGYLNGGEYKDTCISDPSKCIDGFSIQLTFKLNGNTKNTFDNQYFLIDTGASSPDSKGFSIFLMQNETLGFHVADGSHNWCATKSFPNLLENKWMSLMMIFNRSEGITIISNCKDIIMNIPYGRCTPCLKCHEKDMKTSLTIGRPNNIEEDYPTVPMIMSDLEIYFYPLDQTKIFEKCGITPPVKKNNIYQKYALQFPIFNTYAANYQERSPYQLVNPYLTSAYNFLAGQNNLVYQVPKNYGYRIF